jgi:oligopeptide transport system substrate-binding protein
MWNQNLGVTCSIVNQDWKTYFDTLQNKDFQIARGAWVADYLDPISFLELAESDNGNNHTHFSNSEYDALIERARLSPDAGERMQLFQKAEAILVEEAPFVPMYTEARSYFVNPAVKGWSNNVLDLVNYKYVSMQ